LYSATFSQHKQYLQSKIQFRQFILDLQQEKKKVSAQTALYAVISDDDDNQHNTNSTMLHDSQKPQDRITERTKTNKEHHEDKTKMARKKDAWKIPR
jgi:hypothetical protein